MRILIIGREPSDFVSPISKELINNNYVVDLLEYGSFSGIKEDYSFVYQDQYKAFNLNNYSKLSLILGFFSIQFIKSLISSFSIKIALRTSLLNRKFRPIFKQYDIVNFHTMEEQSILLSSFVPIGVKIVFSFWGSDLWGDKKGRLEKQKDALKRASKITMQSPEMKLKFSEKFNSNQLDKVSLQLFGINYSFFSLCERIANDYQYKAAIKEALCIPLSKTVITVSYCGKPVSNQISILKSINKLSSEIKRSIHLIIPLNYGASLEYKKQIESNILGQPYSYMINETFLPLEDLVKLKYASDIYVHANTTDAFSNSMLENIYTKNICLIGDWLPYGLLKNTEVNVIWFNDFDNLTFQLQFAIENKDKIIEEIGKNAQIIKDTFSETSTVKKWIEMFKELE